MSVLLWGSLILFAGLLAHLIIWKIRLPRRQSKSVLVIMLGTLIGALLLIASLHSSGAYIPFPPRSFGDYIHILLFVLSFSLAYLNTYAGIEVDSPSLVMVMIVAKAGNRGLDPKHLFQSLNDDLLVRPRLRDLLLDKMAVLDGGKYRLTPKGRLLARMFSEFRGLIRAGKGG